MHPDYPQPAGALLNHGAPQKNDNANDPDGWPDYGKTFGLSGDDVPHLIRMLNNPLLNDADREDPCVWAELHAWRALAQLGALEAIPDLIRCLDYEDEKEISDWNMEEIPKVLGRMGAPAVEPLAHYLKDDTKGCWSLVAAASGLVHIANAHPPSRPEAIAAITHRLGRYAENDETLNGFLVSKLMTLKAVESVDVIRKAFQAEAVDISVGGDVEDVEIKLGIRQTRSTPRPHYHACGSLCHENHDETEGWRNSLPQPQHAPKIGRNDPCLCGSGKKYKKCCLT